MNWFLIVVSAIFEVAWVIGLKHSDNVLEWMLTVISICISFLLLLYLTKKLPTGTVYTIFVGLGTLGTILCEIILFRRPFQPDENGIYFVANLRNHRAEISNKQIGSKRR